MSHHEKGHIQYHKTTSWPKRVAKNSESSALLSSCTTQTQPEEAAQTRAASNREMLGTECVMFSRGQGVGHTDISMRYLATQWR